MLGVAKTGQVELRVGPALAPLAIDEDDNLLPAVLGKYARLAVAP
jgi:hypothetical protein